MMPGILCFKAAHRALATVVLFALAVCCAAAQPDSRGMEFYGTFMPNYHINASSSNRDSLYLIIAAEQPAAGVIALRDINGQETTLNFSIADPGVVYRVGLSWKLYELRGCNRNGVLNFGGADNQNGTVAPQSFRITSDSEVTVYALSQAEKTSDAMMVLPADVLGTRYYVMSYASDAIVETDIFGRQRLTAQSTPSQCAITAVEDSTTVTIKPSVRVRNGITSSFSVMLHRGDSYLLQADMYSTIPHADLTGTLIESTKPVAVFGGHQRGVVPVATGSLTSRDFLAEQLPPVAAWGKRYLLIPFPSPDDLAPESADIYRVLAAHDNTTVSIGGTAVATLRAGQYYQAQLASPALVEATREVLVAQFKGSSHDSDRDRISDPFFILVPPLKQFLRAYTFASAQVAGKVPVYHEQYITIICPSSARSSIRLDGQPVDQALFKPVPLACYEYATIRVGDGVHRIEADKNIGLYVYGYGIADSYGYVGGMAFTADEEAVIFAGGDTTICRGDTARLSASGGVRYVWKGSNLSCNECTHPIATPDVSTLYTVEIADDNGCTYERKISVRVNQPPVVVCSGDTVICEGGRASLFASGGTTVQWSPPAGLSCTECPAPVASPEQTTTYFATVTNTFGCTTIDSVRVDVSPVPIAQVAGDTTVCTGTPVGLSASGGTAYFWFPSDGLSCTDCASPTATATTTRMYYVQISNDAGCSTLDSVAVTVQPCRSVASISNTVLFTEYSLCDSSDQMCYVKNAGDVPLDIFSWQLRGGNAPAFTAIPVVPDNTDFPITLAVGDSLHFRIVFHPGNEGPLSAELAVNTSGVPEEAVCSIKGEGYKIPVDFSLVPRISTTMAGSRIDCDIRAENGDWSDAALQQLAVEIQYEAGWLEYGGVIIPGEAVDTTWQFSASEVPNSNGMYTTAITATGATPLSPGTVATVQLRVFLDKDRTIAPALRIIPVGRESCVDIRSTSQPIDAFICAQQLRPIRYAGQPLFFDITGGTTETDGVVEVHYGVPFAADAHIEVYTAMGQLVYSHSTVHTAAADIRHTIDLRHHAQQMFIVRCRIADRYMTRQVLMMK